MADSGNKVIKSVIARLTSVSGVTALVGTRVYTDVPQSEAFPYLVVSLPDGEAYKTKDTSDMAHLLRVQVFSRYPGQKESLDIRAAVIEALDRKESFVQLIGYDLIRLEVSSTACFREPDAKTWQAVADFGVLTAS